MRLNYVRFHWMESKRLELIVADGGDGPYYDHADWADAKIISKGKKSFPTLKFIATEPYILTPPAPRNAEN